MLCKVWVRLQFNIIPDGWFKNGMVQFNDVPVTWFDMGRLRIE
jgi:hypothetical protein